MSSDPIAKARALMAETVNLAVKAINSTLSGLSQEEVAAGFEKAPKEAPLWAHACLNMASKAVSNDVQKGATGPTALRVILIEKAGNNEEWLKMAQPYQKPAIEAVATPVEPKK